MDRDVYANLLRESRGLDQAHATQREEWFAALPWPDKEQVLFELEVLLKGMVCFGNFQNHPGEPTSNTLAAQDFRGELRILRDALDQSIRLIRRLLGSRDRTYTFTRYLQTVLPEDTERMRLVKEQLTQNTPQEALSVLRNAFGSYRELTDALGRLGHVGNRYYFALHGMITREIERNTFFNPLVALEFRPEFDRIRIAEILEALEHIPSPAAHRLVCLTFLTLFRTLRYLKLVETYAAELHTVPLTYLVLAVIRSDLRALTRFLGVRAHHALADGLERELLQLPAFLMQNDFSRMKKIAKELVSLRALLENLSHALRLEIRKSFEKDLPAPDAMGSGRSYSAKLQVLVPSLRALVHESIHSLCHELRPHQPVPELAQDVGARRAQSERLRVEIWMFLQVLRAFLAKASVATHSADQWTGHGNFRFVREFLGHFRAIGYQLVRWRDYTRLEPLLAALDSLKDVDLLEPERIEQAVIECEALFEYLDDLLKQVSARAELQSVPFDKVAASETLKLYLSAG